jgi:predicted Zn finger-like uncharacterized protein
MYVQTWYEYRCPSCSSANFVSGGDANDPSGFDPQAVKCWKCGHCFDHEGEDADEDMCDEGEPVAK